MAARDPNKIAHLYPIEGLSWLDLNPQNLSEQGILISVRSNRSASQRSRMKTSQHLMSVQQLVDYIITQAVISGNKWGIQDEGSDQNVLRSSLNFVGAGVTIVDDGASDRLNIVIPADMTRIVYDPNDDGSVLNSDAILGVLTAGNNQYYGTDGSGIPGFHNNASAIAGHNIRSQQYDAGSGNITDDPFDTRTILDFGPEFNVEDAGIGPDRTLVLDTAYATLLDATIQSPGIGGFPEGTVVGAIRGETYIRLFNDIIFPVVDPIYVEPTATLGISPGDPLEINFVKTGLPVVITFTSDYTQNDGGATTNYRLQEDDVNIDSAAGGITHVFAYSFQKFLPGLTFNQQFVYHVEFDFNEGVVLDDSHGNPSGDPPGPGTEDSDDIIIAVIFPYYFGVSASKIPTPAEIAAATEIVEPNGVQLQVPAVSGIDEHFFVATSLASPNLYPFWHLNDGNSGPILAGNFIEYNIEVIDDPDGNFVSAPYSIYSTPYPNEINGTLTLSLTDEFTTP